MGVWASSSVTSRVTSIRFPFGRLFGLMKFDLSVWRQAARRWPWPETPAGKGSHGTRSVLGSLAGCQALCPRDSGSAFTFHLSPLLYVCPPERWSRAEERERRLEAKFTRHRQDPSSALPAFSPSAQLCKTPFDGLILTDGNCARGLAVRPCVILAPGPH